MWAAGARSPESDGEALPENPIAPKTGVHLRLGSVVRCWPTKPLVLGESRCSCGPRFQGRWLVPAARCGSPPGWMNWISRAMSPSATRGKLMQLIGRTTGVTRRRPSDLPSRFRPDPPLGCTPLLGLKMAWPQTCAHVDNLQCYMATGHDNGRETYSLHPVHHRNRPGVHTTRRNLDKICPARRPLPSGNSTTREIRTQSTRANVMHAVQPRKQVGAAYANLVSARDTKPGAE